MEENFFENLLGSGFAVAVSAFLLVRLERELKQLREAIEGLRRCQVCIVRDEREGGLVKI